MLARPRADDVPTMRCGDNPRAAMTGGFPEPYLDAPPLKDDAAASTYPPDWRWIMVEARWNGTLIARSDDTVVVEGNHYFPADAVDAAMLQASSTTTICPWKGIAHYHSLSVDGAVNPAAAWYYSDPKPEAENIRGRIAFWKGVEVG